MGKRANKEGTVYESPEGSGRWWAQLPAGPDGKRPRRLAESKEAAAALLRRMHLERDAGRDLSRKAETVAELVKNYLDAIGGQQRLSTRRLFASRAKHITGAIGAMKIDAVDLDTAQGLANRLAAKKLSPAVVRAVLGILSAAYERIIPDRIARNPVNWKKLRLRKGKPAERRPLDEAQLRALLIAVDDAPARGVNVRYAPAVWLAALTGMRRGEICGATWRDLDWKKGELKVRTQLALAEDGSYQLGQDLKTDESVRVIPLGPRLLARLREHWEFLQAERKLRGAAWQEHGLIVCDEHGKPLSRSDMLNRHLNRLTEAADLPHVHPHLLRHTVATLISEEGFSEAVIAAILGHSRGKNTTIRYTHATEKAKRAAMSAVESRILGAAEESAREAR